MIAIFKTGGKQYVVKAGQILKVEKLDGKKGDNISFKDVLAVSDSNTHVFGEPIVKDASVNAIILEQKRDKKIVVFKKRRRQNYRSKQGHRQNITVLKIDSISQGTKKSVAPQMKKIDTKIDKKIDKKIEEKKVVAKKVAKKKKTTKEVKKTTPKKKKVAKKKITGKE